MPSIWSKLIPFPDMSLPFNCYEVGHTWTPFCTRAALDIGSSVFIEGLKMYTGVYLFGQAAARRYDFKSFQETVKSIIRSSIFLGFNAYSVLILFCFTFKSLGKLYLALIGHLPSIIGSYLAIHLEKPSRRGPLAFYVANIAAETVFRILVSSKIIKPINNGEVMLFTVTMGILMYFIKKNGIGQDMISYVLRLVIGQEELGRPRRKLSTVEQLEPALPSIRPQPLTQLPSKFHKQSSGLYGLVGKLSQGVSSFVSKYHSSCPHTKDSCFTYVTSSFVQRFLLGWTGMSLMPTLIRRPNIVLTKPERLMQSLSQRRNINFGLFLALLASVYRATSCTLRWTDNGPKNWHGAVAGLASGISMIFYPNKTIAQYLFWKMIETLFWEGVKKRKITRPELIICLTYALSCSQLFFVAVVCPKNMRPSYMKFLDRFTHRCLHLLNRNIIDLFGTQSSAGFDIFYPNLDPQYTSRQFQESVLVWTIQ